jgi:hypothetical protein
MRVAIAFAVFALLGCADVPRFTEPPPQTAGPTYPIPGTYALATIDGALLPVEYPRGLRITSSRLIILPDGTWTETRSGRTEAGVQSQGFGGTWTRSGNGVALRVGSTPFYNGEATASGVLLTSGGTLFTYSRE